MPIGRVLEVARLRRRRGEHVEVVRFGRPVKGQHGEALQVVAALADGHPVDAVGDEEVDVVARRVLRLAV